MDSDWKRSEAKNSKRLGMRRSPRSGGGGVKGDYQSSLFLAENKHSTNPRGVISVKASSLAKVTKEAEAVGRLPAMVFETCSGSIACVKSTDFLAVLPDEDVDLPVFECEAQSFTLRLPARERVHSSFCLPGCGEWTFISLDEFYWIQHGKKKPGPEGPSKVKGKQRSSLHPTGGFGPRGHKKLRASR